VGLGRATETGAVPRWAKERGAGRAWGKERVPQVAGVMVMEMVGVS